MTSEHAGDGGQKARLKWMLDEFLTARNRRLLRIRQLPVAQPDPEQHLPAAVEIALTAPVPPPRR